MTDSPIWVDFTKLERRTRTLALVGNYLQMWASMEIELDEAIAKALDLDGLQQYVLRSNMAFHNKVHVMGALLELSYLNKHDKDHYAHVLNQMLSYTSDRNTVAHEGFYSSDKSDGVRFVVAKARGKVQFPDIDWSIAKFTEIFSNLGRCSREMAAMREKISRVASLATLLSAQLPTEPILGLGGIGSLGLLSLPPPADHTSATSSANPETDDEIPPSSPE